VAIKILNARFVEDEAAQIRFRREARAAGRLQHANAVTVTDFGTTSDGFVYFVMELLEGRTLREVLAREAPFDTARAVSVMLQISAAVGAAHQAGIIHRDLKPANIFIVQRANTPPTVKVLDFGIAKLAAEALEDDEDHMTLTQVGVMIGTPRYMSPEQCDGVPLTPASDVYSLGIILYEMLTGMTPFTGSTPLAVAMKHSTSPPRPPSEIVGAIPEPIEQLVLHALEKNPADRPANADEFRRELYATAERLGLEHSGILTTLSLETLRNAGTESPSGRLVVDLERFRQNRATASGANEITVVRPVAERAETVSAIAGRPQSSDESIRVKNYEFPRMTVPVNRQALTKLDARKQMILVGAALVVLMMIGLAFVLSQSRPESAPLTSDAVTATPTPEASLSPSPTPTPQTAPARAQRRSEPTPAPQKKKGGSAFGKLKRIFKNPF